MLRIAAMVLLAAAVPAAAFDSGDIQPGATWSKTFTEVNEAGYSYHCHPHPWMTGMVHVEADDAPGVKTWNVDIVEPEDSQQWGYSVEHLVIEAGDTVVWTNTGQMVHTVTEEAGGNHHHGDEDHDEHGHDSPPAGAVWLLVALAALAFRRR